MPSDSMLKTMNSIHRAVVKLSGGRMGWSAGKMPVLELTTTGRKSGQKRAVMLTSPVQEGDVYVIVASKGGEDEHPAWFLNLRDNPSVEVSVKGKPAQSMLARVATSAERDRLWLKVTATYKNYASYQKKTEREIPLVFLEPSR